MNVRKRVAAAAVTAAVGAGLALTAPAAQAAPAGGAGTQGWHMLFDQPHGPTNKWSTPDFVPDRGNLHIVYGCYGHDGAKIKAEIVRTKDRKVVGRSNGSDWCADGAEKKVTTGNVRAGDAYYIRLKISGPKHSLYARAFDSH
ncbi:hypothetical protein [Streptomyces sp. NPDC049585]|uniref:hypothetical protein n=1 Tax=Streptomyces sp. NPDC049585 TaxID=3155154 RepID=UPI003438AA57